MSVNFTDNHAQDPADENILATDMADDASLDNARDALSLAEIMQYPYLISGGDILAEKIAGLIAPSLHSMGYGLVRVIFDDARRLQIMIFRLDEITIGVQDCASVSRHLSAVLDVEDPIASQYTLEISSAGLNCPLTHARDFHRHIGAEIKLEMNNMIHGFKKNQRGFTTDGRRFYYHR